MGVSPEFFFSLEFFFEEVAIVANSVAYLPLPYGAAHRLVYYEK
jgi:hypothetical protein